MFEIGPSLREARRRRGLSAADVQQAIRIRERYLVALEEERWELLPGEAYAKGFLRTYADFLGLDGSLYLDEYASRFGHGEEEPFLPAPLPRPGSRRIARLRPVLAVGTLVAAVAAVAAWQLRSPGASSPPKPAARATPPASTHATSTGPATTATTRTRAPAPAPLPTRAVLDASRGRVWLLVRAGGASGAVLYEGILEQGRTLPVSVLHPVWVRVGAPWNLDVRLGGRVLHGLPAQPGNVLLTRRGMSPAP